jgi:hypothetical protein
MFPWKNLDLTEIRSLTKAIEANTRITQLVAEQNEQFLELMKAKDKADKPESDPTKTYFPDMSNWLFFDDPNYNGKTYKNLEHAILGGLRKQNFSLSSFLSIFADRYTSKKVVDGLSKLTNAQLVKSVRAKRGGGAVFQITKRGRDILKSKETNSPS